MYGKILKLCRVGSLNNVRCLKDSSTKKLLEFLADMPKANSARIANAQRQRQNISKKSEKYGPSTVYLQVLGSGARGAPNTLYLFTDQKRYLFNCGECTQRLAHEHKVKLSRLDHIFITSKTWKNIGGLPGLSLTLQDVGVPNITLHGPEGLDELYNATKRFVIMKDMNVTMANCSPSEDFDDNVMSVKYVLLGPHDDILVQDLNRPAAKKPKLCDSSTKEFQEFIHDDTDYYNRPELRHHEAVKTSEPKKYVKERIQSTHLTNKEKVAADPIKKKTEKVLHDLQKKSNCTVAFICSLKKRMGTLDLAKCVDLGVKPGPMLGQLKSGQDVVLPDGTLILARDVKTPDDPGPVFIVLEVPDLMYLKEAEFQAHFDNGVNPPENIPSLIVHFTPPHVFHNPAYQAFMSLFGPSTRHLTLNDQNSCLGSEAVHRTQHKLHLLDPDIFPLLRDGSVPAVWNAQPPLPKTSSPIRLKGLEELKDKIALAQFQNIINMEGSCKGDCQPAGLDHEQEAEKVESMVGRTLTIFHLRPKKQLDRSAEPKLHIQDYIQESMDVDGFVGSLEQFRRLVDSMRYAKLGSQNEYPKVVFLGTGSCIPSKTRNTSAIVIHIDENRSMLLDCGEGTFGQLVRFYGPKRVFPFLRTLNAIYVSHLHADHHIGLIGVIQARRQAFEEVQPDAEPEPVYLLAPGQIVSWLSIYDQQFERIRREFTLIPNQSLLQNLEGKADMTPAVMAAIGVKQIQTCLVSHCPNAFGVSVEVGNHKITYSGDTIPCEALIKLGENSTLLIHEATMEDELAEEARVKMHSTTTQAIEIGRQMNAQYTVLTHFSQRYARLPRLNANILHDNNSVGIAFDNMQITMSDLELLPHMYAPLQLMFAEHCVEMELKAASRARHKERHSNVVVESEASRSRRLSPGCRGAYSTQVARAPPRYRESNSSRLRQELKGMTMSGSMTRSPRSKTPSPRSRSRPSTPRSLQSEGSTQRRRDFSSEKLLDVIAAPRSLSGSSDTFNINQAKELAEAASIVDTRSKTLNSVSRIRASEETDTRACEKKTPAANKVGAADPGHNNGYGKPLVTPMNKRLTFLRDIPQHMPPASTTSAKGSMSPLRRKISPDKRKDCWYSSGRRGNHTRIQAMKIKMGSNTITSEVFTAEIRWCTSPSPCNPSPLSRPKLPTKSSDLANKLLPSNSCANGQMERTDKSPMSRIPGSAKGLKWLSSSQEKLNSSPTRPGSPMAQKTEVMNGRPTKPSRIKPPMVRKPCCMRNNGNDVNKSNGKEINRIDEKVVHEKTLPSFRDTLNENLKKQTAYKENKPTRPNTSIHSNRSFKPQLEDIKSSFILMNKKINERNHKENEKSNISVPSMLYPKPHNENERREQLNEIKKKFQSRGFCNDARFDKIEGLNWISWK